MSNIIDYAVSYIVHNTRYTPYQCYRVIELINKYGNKTPYYLTKKQYKIMEMLVYLLGGTMPQTEENKEKVVVNPEVYEKITGEKE